MKLKINLKKILMIVAVLAVLVLIEELSFHKALSNRCATDDIGYEKCMCVLNYTRLKTPVWKWHLFWQIALYGSTSEAHPEMFIDGLGAFIHCRDK